MPSALSRRTWLTLVGGTALAWPGRRLLAQVAGADFPAPERLINLGGNENPLGPSPAVLRAILQAAPFSARYPFREEERLREQIAAREDVDLACVVLGQGCDDVLALAAHACIQPMDTLVCTAPTYFQLPDYAAKLGARLREVPHLSPSMRHDLPGLARAVDATTRLVYVCNPDNPTGTECSAADMTAFCREVAPRCPVVVDEVYLELTDDFAEKTQVARVREGLPVIITRSFSKVHGLAGHRIGYAVTTPALATAMTRWQRSGLNYLGVAAARAALHDLGFVESSRVQIRAARSRYTRLLDELGLAYTPSQGNFVFHEVRRPMADYQAALKRRGFYVGWPHPAAAAYPTWCRTSLGTTQEMDLLEMAMRAEFATPSPTPG